MRGPDAGSSLSTFKKIFQSYPGASRILSSISWLSAERIFTLTVNIFVSILVLRHIGTQDFGKLAYGISFVALFTELARLGMDGILVRELVKAKSESEAGTIMCTGFVLKAVASLLTVGALYASTFWLPHDSEKSRVILFVALSLLFSPFDIFKLWFQSKVIAGPVAIVKLTQVSLSALLKVYFILQDFPLIAFAGVFALDLMLLAVGHVVVFRSSQKPEWKWAFSTSHAKSFLKDSWPMIFAGLMVSVYTNVDQVMLGAMLGDSEVGIYAAAVRFSEVWYFIPLTVCASVYPSIVKYKQDDEGHYYKKLQHLFDFMGWLSIVIAVCGSIFALTLLRPILGSGYEASGPILALHIWATPFVFLGVARSNWILAENRADLAMFSTAFGMISNVGLNYLLIPRYGGLGAAFATVFSYFTSTYLSSVFFPSLFRAAWMLTKALFVPFRFSQNRYYVSLIRKTMLKAMH